MRFSAVFFLFPFLISGQTNYYMDATNGSDANAGTNPGSPWKTLVHLNAAAIQPGDSIFFKRGEVWRDQLLPKSGTFGMRVYYGAYGAGNKPKLLGSHAKNAQNDWQLVSGNLWKCTTTYPVDIGNLIFDDEASVGMKKWTLAELQQQDDFFYNGSTDEVYIYSTQNPALIHSNIELAIRRHIIDHSNCAYATFEELDLRYGAAHGFGGSGTQYLEIRRCSISYIGGGDLAMNGSNVRYGNGIEFWGAAIGNLVEQNTIFEIYDTGLTNQNHTDIHIQRDITYRYNVVYNCGMAALEIWNRPAASETKNIRFENNTCYNNGYGWGTQRPDYSGAGIAFWHNESQLDSVFIRNNIFLNSQRTTYFIEDQTGYLGKTMDNNIIYNASTQDTVYWNYGVNVFNGAQMSSYQATTGFDNNGLYADPQLVDIFTADFRPTVGSPCIDAGAELSNTYDFLNTAVPQNGIPDVGAYEWFVGLGSTEMAEEELTIFPNPAEKTLTIRGVSEASHQVFSIVDAAGRSVFVVFPENESNQIDVRGLPAGIYTIRIASDQGTSFLPFIKL